MGSRTIKSMFFCNFFSKNLYISINLCPIGLWLTYVVMCIVWIRNNYSSSFEHGFGVFLHLKLHFLNSYVQETLINSVILSYFLGDFQINYVSILFLLIFQCSQYLL